MSENKMRDLAAEIGILEEKLKAQAAELNAARSAAQSNADMAGLGQFISGMAHELRGPLGAILTSLHVVEGRLRDPDPATLKGLDRIRRGVKRCDDTISLLLEFSRDEPLNVEETGIDQWLQALFHSRTLPEGVSLCFKQGLGDGRYAIDREQLARAVSHVVDNAAEAIRESGAPGRVAVDTHRAAAMFEIRIADTGPEIPEDQLATIFEPLFGGHRSGLGLAVARRIVERHGGRIDAKSHDGGGTAVTIALPAERPPSAS